MNSEPLTEPLVEAKDQSRQTELRSEFAQALLTVRMDTTVLVWRATTLILVALGSGVAIIPSALPGS